MPTYEYSCPQCGRFETFQRITEDALSTCPTCEGPVRRLISRNVNILFKGSGFHCTDYRKSSPNGSADKDGASGSGSGEKVATDAESA